MHVLNIGSLNIDNVYQVPHFLRGGETVAAYRRTLHVGGKGLNQSVALARAGIASSHAGIIGRDGEVLKNFLEAEGVNVAHVEMRADEASGHTVIQISPEGENAILYYPGTNTCLTREFVKNAVSDLKQGDVLLLQNETNAIRDAIEIGLEKGLRIVFNPAPFDRSVPLLPLNQTAALILNEGEARGLYSMDEAAAENLDDLELLTALGERYPNTTLLITLGARGVAVRIPGQSPKLFPAYRVDAVVDTTAAGDTFTGYAVRALTLALNAEEKGEDPARCRAILEDGIKYAVTAAALSVTRAGAAESIPHFEVVDAVVADLWDTEGNLR